MRPLAIVTALLLVLAAGVVAVVAWRDEPRAAGLVGAVTLLGDSLNVGVEPYLADELEGWRIEHHNQVGRTGQEGLAELTGLGAAIAPVLVVSLGTNDPQTDTAGFRRLVDGVMRRAGPRRCVVWSTIWIGESSDSLNDVLRAAARRHANLELADWAELVADDPDALAFDGVHGSPRGYARKAEQIARIAERCNPRPEPAP